MPEQALMINTESGLMMITGCCHPGILTMAGKAKQCFPLVTVAYILGGFHLMNQNREVIDSIVSALTRMGVLKVWPTHCTGENARVLFRKHFGENCVVIGSGSQFEV